MKQIYFDKKKGKAKLKIGNLDDLWYLSQIIENGDLIEGKTIRKIKIGKEQDRKQAIIKKPVFLRIQVEKIEFSKTSDVLRVSGKIVEAPDEIQKGVYHTFNLGINSTVKIIKERWLGYQIDRLKEACKEKKYEILICVMDRDEAYFALLKKYGYEILTHITGDVSKKGFKEKIKENFYFEIIRKLSEYIDRYDIKNVILASPAFWKEELIKEIKDEELKKKIILASCNATGKNGINEVLRRPEIKEALRQERITKEISLVEEVLKEISKNNLAVYGLKDVERAAVVGAIENLILTDTIIKDKREEGNYEKLENIMKSVEKTKGKVFIISSEHEGGRKLNGLGGIAAIIRFKLSY